MFKQESTLNLDPNQPKIHFVEDFLSIEEES